MAPVGIDHGRSGDGDVWVRVKIGNELVEGARLDGGVVVEDELVLGVTALQQAIVVCPKPCSIRLFDEVHRWELLAHGLAGSILRGVVEYVNGAG